MRLSSTRTRLAAALAVVLVAGLGPGAAVGSAAPAAPGPGQALKDAVQKLQTTDKLPGAVGMVRDGDTVEYANSGYADVYKRTPADPHAKFRIGSNTKMFVATVILQLEAEGKLSLDDTVDHWLPGVVNRNGNDGKKITIRQVLNHTSGIPEFLTGLTSVEWVLNLTPRKPYPAAKVVQLGTAAKPAFQPGTAWGYSNTNYALADMIINAVTGNPASVEVTKRIIEPLGLHDTTFPTTPEIDGTRLNGYESVLGLFNRDATLSNVQMTGAAGAMVSTGDDLTRFVQAQFAGELLRPAQLRELQTTVPTAKDGSGYDYGLGVGLVKTPCGEAWAHSGATVGYMSVWYTDKAGKRQVSIAINQFPTTAGTSLADLNNAAQAALCA